MKNIIKIDENELKNIFSEDIYKNYIKGSYLTESSGIFKIITNSEKKVEYLEKIKWFLEEEFSRILNTDLEIDEIIFKEDKKENQDSVLILSDGINQSYSFENLIVGNSNERAYMLSKQFAQTPDDPKISSLFIYGDSGLGKTHLLHAIGNFIKEYHSEKRVLYISSNDFINEFIEYSRNKKLNIFLNKYKNIDVLLFDDFQLLNKETMVSSKEILFNILESAIISNRKIIFTSDQKPNNLKWIEKRIITRINMGLVSEINNPEIEVRYKIIENKIKENNYEGIDAEVIKYIAENIGGSVRNLEGALSNLVSSSVAFGEYKINLKNAKKWISHLVNSPENDAKIDKIKQETAKEFGVTLEDINSKSRKREYVVPRHAIIYLLYNSIKLSKAKIAKEMGNIDHTTVSNALEKITENIQENKVLESKINNIIKRI